MKAWHEFLRRIARSGRRARFDDDLDAEIEFHIEVRADELIESGAPRAEALAQARREFGSRLRARESSDEAWRFQWFEDLRADIRYAIRTFRRSPAFTATAVASLALGIGASSAMFAALDAILWKPLPVSDPASLVRVSLTRAAAEETQLLPLDYVEQLRAAGIFSDLILSSGDGLSFAYDGRAERIWTDASSGADLMKRMQALPGFGKQKAQIFVALLAKQLGVRPDGWEAAVGAYAEDGYRSVADVTDPASLQKVRDYKKAKKAAASA